MKVKFVIHPKIIGLVQEVKFDHYVVCVGTKPAGIKLAVRNFIIKYCDEDEVVEIDKDTQIDIIKELMNYRIKLTLV